MLADRLNDALRALYNTIATNAGRSGSTSLATAIEQCDYARTLDDCADALHDAANDIRREYESVAVDHLQQSPSGQRVAYVGNHQYHVHTRIAYQVTDSARFHDYCVRAGISIYLIVEAARSKKALKELCTDLLIVENRIPDGVSRYPEERLTRRMRT